MHFRILSGWQRVATNLSFVSRRVRRRRASGFSVISSARTSADESYLENRNVILRSASVNPRAYALRERRLINLCAGSDSSSRSEMKSRGIRHALNCPLSLQPKQLWSRDGGYNEPQPTFCETRFRARARVLPSECTDNSFATRDANKRGRPALVARVGLIIRRNFDSVCL